MKKTLFIIAVFATILTMSCEEPKETNPFVGTWENESGEGLRYVFSENYVEQYTIENESIRFKGRYTYDDTHITISTDYRSTPFDDLNIYPDPFVWTYRFENNVLVIGIGSFIKITN